MSEPIAPEHAEQAKGLAGKLQHKVGPFPLWLWIGLGGGVMLLLVHRGSGTGGSTGGATGDVPADTTAPPDSSGLPPSGGPIGDPNPAGNLGGFEDPTSFGFADPSGDPQTSGGDPTGIRDETDTIPFPTNPVFTGSPREHVAAIAGGLHVSPEQRAGVARIASALSGPDTRQSYAQLVAGLRGDSGGLVHPGDSPAGRMAGATTSASVSPGGRTIFGMSSYAANNRRFE